MNYVLKAKCEGECKKEQTITYEDFTREYVERVAGLMDGTSPLYVFKPNGDSTLGKCETCGGKFTCTVHDAVDGTIKP